MPMLNGTILYLKMCAHLGSYFEVTTIVIFIRSKYITIITLYLLFYVIMMSFYLYICNYVTYCATLSKQCINKKIKNHIRIRLHSKTSKFCTLFDFA